MNGIISIKKGDCHTNSYEICAECGEDVALGECACFLGGRLYCMECVRHSKIAVGIYTVVAPIGKAENVYEKRLYFRERNKENEKKHGAKMRVTDFGKGGASI